MAFNAAKFNKEKFAPRTAKIAVPELKEYFGDGDDATWEVRGLTGLELAKVQESDRSADQAAKIVAALARNSAKDKSDAILSMMGLDSETPADLSKRIEQLVCASVEPKCDRHLASRMFEFHPIVAYNLTNKILELTGLGAEPGKQKASTAAKASK